MLEWFFRLSAKRITAGRGVLAGAAAFLTMAHIAFVNPGILSAAGMAEVAGTGSGSSPRGTCSRRHRSDPHETRAGRLHRQVIY